MDWARERRSSIVLPVVVVAAVILVGWVAVRSTLDPVIGQDRAVAIAREFYASEDTHGAGTTTNNVSVQGVRRVVASGRSAWRVEISGDVTEAGSGVTYQSYMLLDVDAETGAVTIFAQG